MGGRVVFDLRLGGWERGAKGTGRVEASCPGRGWRV